MDTTVRPLTLLEALAATTRTTATLELLRRASLAPHDIATVGRLVSFLAWPERISCLEAWAPESAIASDLAQLGHAAWAAPLLLEAIRPVGRSHRAERQMEGRTEERYLAAMAAARPVTRLDQPEAALFAERLRTLLLVRALEATRAGVARERYLETACVNLRHAADKEFSPVWNWIRLICHPENAGWEDFVSTTLFHCENALATPTQPPPDAKVREALRHLGAVLVGRRTAIRPKGEKGRDGQETGTLANGPPALPEPDQASPAPAVSIDHLSTTDANAIASVGDEDGEGHLFLVTNEDSKRPPRAQRSEGTGLIWQSIEEVQFLRHSWHRLGRHEVQAFLDRLIELQQGLEAQDRLGSALVGIAAAASVPLSRISRVRIQSELADDWAVDLKCGRLQRRPPRPSRRWQADSNTNGWVRPMADKWQIELPQATLSTLRSLRKRGGVSLSELWDGVSPNVTLESWFGSRFATGPTLSRLTSPVVPNILAQGAFEANLDHAEARLLSSSTRSAIPAACTYGSFRVDEVHATWSRGLHPELGSMQATTSHAQGNAAGSELDVDVARLRSAIARLTGRVNATAADSAEWVAHHNLLTALCIVTLFASTGARPVNSPFESLGWFDLDRRLVYVEDKRSGPTQGARLCVLSDVAHDLVSHRYLPHIESLQQALATSAPKFSEQLRKLQRPRADCGLPLFFFLRSEPNFDWIEVSMTQLDIVCDNPWPLPWNLFRHLQSTHLRRKGLPAEIRDALLSHGERGAESHGEFSWRTPCNDLEWARPMVNSLADDLGLALPRGSVLPHTAHARLSDPDFTQRPSFGRAAREARREKSLAAAKRAAQAEIDRLLNKRPPQTLSADEWEKIARAMILRADGDPHAMGSVRAEVFEDYLAQLWRDKRIRAAARRRYTPIEEGHACFNEDAISAQRDIAELRIALDATTDGLSRRLKPALAGCLAAIELALHCRVSNVAVLAAVSCNHASVNVVRFMDRHWLEFGYHGQWSDGRPVYRVPITARAVGWITVRQGTKKRLRALPSIPVQLKAFGGIQADRFADVLRRICWLVAQANAFELPGVLAAVLRGSRESPALPHSDWVRMTYLQAASIGEEDPSDSTIATNFLPGRAQAPPTEDTEDPARCAALFDAIQKKLSQPLSTRQMAADVSRLVKQSGFGAGSAPFVLGHYMHHLLTRSKKTDKSETLKADTALRYWYALKAGILDFAYDAHLPALDDLELTELYQNIVDAAESAPDAAGARQKSARRRALKADTDAGQRARKEIRDFHEFARDIYGLEDPDWSEISPGISAGLGRPGLVLLAEYEAMLGTLACFDNCSALDDGTLTAAFVLLTCARFGLRIGEAVGLSYADWVEVGGATVLLVRSNAIRGLKTEASKRQVPLVGQFNALEQAVVDEVRRRWVLREDPSAVQRRLLPHSGSDSFRTHKKQIAKRLLPLIKATTGNPASTVHHLRHGFACRLLTLLHGRPCGMGLPCDEQSTLSTRRLLLQADVPDRRTMWAVARMLGHTSPATTIKSYIHVLDQWLPSAPDRCALVHAVRGRNFVDLDALPRSDLISRLEPLVIADAPEPAQPLFERYVQYLRLRAADRRDACDVARVSPAERQHLDDVLNQVVGRLAGKRAADPFAQLASRVPEKRWRALAVLAGRASLPSPEIAVAAWLPTVGASRQVVLFQSDHFDWMSCFVSALGLTQEDCCLVHRSNADPALLQLASAPGINMFLSPSHMHGRTFQLDRAVELAPKRVYPNRMVLMVRPGGRLATSFELLLLWAAWLATGHTF